MHCGKTADRIRMSFGIVGRTGLGMRQVVQFGECSAGRGTFRGKFGARHCSQWGLYGVRVQQRRDAALLPNYFGQTFIICYMCRTTYLPHFISSRLNQRANSVLRCFVFGNVRLLVRAFVVYVRPVLQYDFFILSSHLKQDIIMISNVHRRFTKRLHTMAYTKNNIGLYRLQSS